MIKKLDILAFVIFSMLFLCIGIMAFIFNLKVEENNGKVTYEELYFEDGALVSGDAVIQSIERFRDLGLKIFVGTNAGSVRIYEEMPYEFGMAKNNSDYINPNGIFRVTVQRTDHGNEIGYISFYQE